MVGRQGVVGVWGGVKGEVGVKWVVGESRVVVGSTGIIRVKG